MQHLHIRHYVSRFRQELNKTTIVSIALECIMGTVCYCHDRAMVGMEEKVVPQAISKSRKRWDR